MVRRLKLLYRAIARLFCYQSRSSTMAARDRPDLTLTYKSPYESYQHESHNTDKIAVYTLVGLGEDGSDGLVKALENDDGNLRNAASLPPRYDFAGRSLRDVYDYHLQLGREQTHHPTLFIVAYVEDYQKNGVLVVELDTDLKCSVDTCRRKTADALLDCVNLEISNMDWEELKDDELPPPDELSGQDDAPGSAQPASQSTVHPSPSRSTFGAYGTVEGANMTAARGLLEPDWLDKARGDWLCEAVCSYTDTPEPLNEVRKWHPWNCRSNPRLHRNWCICVDGKNPKENGVLLLRIDWDGNIDRDPNELLRVGLEGSFETERSPVDRALATLGELTGRGEV